MANSDLGVVTQVSKKAKWLNVLKIFGYCLGGIAVFLIGVVVYVWATGGFNPPYVPLTNEWHFSQNEYVIDGNYDSTGNVNLDKDGNPIYETIKIIPNEGCTELDAVIKISSWQGGTNNQPLALVVDKNTSPVIDTDNEDETADNNTEDQDDNNEQQAVETVYDKYYVKINQDIKLRPITQLIDEKPVNIGGWVKLTATNFVDGKEGQRVISCWVFIDSPVQSYKIRVKEEDGIIKEDDAEENVLSYSVTSLVTPQIVLTDEDNNSTVFPSNSLLVPSTNVPTSKKNERLTSSSIGTDFLNKKSFIYLSSNTNIATVDENGLVTILPGNEGGSFAITSYIINKYNNIGKMPVLSDFKDNQDPEAAYKDALAKITLNAKTKIIFNIKSIGVTGIVTEQSQTNIYEYSVFDTQKISLIGDKTQISKNKYYVEIQFGDLTDKVSNEVKNAYLKYVEVVCGIEGTPDDYDVLQNGVYIKFSSDYATITTQNSVFYLNILQYRAGNNYLVFRYLTNETQDNEKTYVDAYSIFTIAEPTSATFTFDTKEIEINKDSDEVYSISSFIKNVSNNATYSRIFILAPQDQTLITMDNSMAVEHNNKKYCIVGMPNDQQEYDYAKFKLNSKSVGTVQLYASILKTNKDDSLFKDADGNLVCIYLYGNETTPLSKTISVFEEIKFGANGDKKDVFSVVNDDGSKLSAAPEKDEDGNINIINVAKGDIIKLTINYIGSETRLRNNLVLLSADDTKLECISEDYTKEGQLVVRLEAKDSGGPFNFTITYNQDGGFKYSILFNIKNIDLNTVSLLTDTDGNSSYKKIGVDFTENSKKEATEWNWQELKLKTNFYLNDNVTEYAGDVKGYLNAYSLPNDLITDDDDTIISKLSSIDKSGLKSSNEVLEITYKEGSYTTDLRLLDNVVFNIKKPGKVLIYALTTNNIASNIVFIDIAVPEITIEYSSPEDENDENAIIENGYVVGEKVVSYGSMEAIGGQKTSARTVDLYTRDIVDSTINKIGFKCGETDITSLVKFKFKDQIKKGNEYISNISGASISENNNRIMTLTNLLQEQVIEEMTAYADFGYEKESAFKYELESNYKISVNSDRKCYLPSKVDLFSYDGSINPYITITSKDGKSLFIPINSSINATDGNYESYNYIDENGQTAYYHIYKTVVVNNIDGTSSWDGAVNLDYSTNALTSIDVKIVQDMNSSDIKYYKTKVKITTEPLVEATYSSAIKIDSAGNKSIECSMQNEGPVILYKPNSKDGCIQYTVNNTTDVPNVNLSIDFYLSDSLTNEDYYVYSDGNSTTYYWYTPSSLDSSGGKRYIKIEDEEYVAVNNAKANYLKEYFEIVQTQDQAIDNQKSYFIKDNDNVYKKVIDPSIDNLNNYYEVTKAKTFKQGMQYFRRNTFVEADSVSVDQTLYVQNTFTINTSTSTDSSKENSIEFSYDIPDCDSLGDFTIKTFYTFTIKNGDSAESSFGDYLLFKFTN